MLRRLLAWLKIVDAEVKQTGAELEEVKKRSAADLHRLAVQQRENEMSVRALEAELDVYRQRNGHPS